MNPLSFLFSKIGVWIASTVGFVILIVLIVKTTRNGSVTRILLKVAIFVVGYGMLLIGAQVLLLSDFRSSSLVDTEPLYKLADIPYISEDDLGKILNAINLRSDFGKTREYLGAYAVYRFGWHCDNPKSWEPGGVMVDISYLNSNEEAVATLNSYSNMEPYTSVLISDSIRAYLYDSRMDRNADTFYAADWQKHTRTNISVCNISIHVYEQTSFSQACKWTSEFIDVFCDLLLSVLLCTD